MSTDRETTVVQTGGGAGWFVAVILLAAIAFGGYYVYANGGLDTSKTVNVTIQAPEAPAQPAK